ncbi:MAG TPA: hypothetical protein VGU20_13525 [Stellaceae bacterium]|nr:hypothetical protein [Stellaceae bacterium]
MHQHDEPVSNPIFAALNIEDAERKASTVRNLSRRERSNDQDGENRNDQNCRYVCKGHAGRLGVDSRIGRRMRAQRQPASDAAPQTKTLPGKRKIVAAPGTTEPPDPCHEQSGEECLGAKPSKKIKKWLSWSDHDGEIEDHR